MPKTNQTVRFIDLFAGLGGMRIGLENALSDSDMVGECVFTSEIKPHAVSTYTANFPNSPVSGNITQVPSDSIPAFDILLAGFPCQPFSYAGKGLGFADTRGSLFFEIHRILEHHRPTGFILENVEGLVTHDRLLKTDKIGRTLSVILQQLHELGYKTSWKVLDSSVLGGPQARKRLYIVGTLQGSPLITYDAKPYTPLGKILEPNASNDLVIDNELAALLLQKFAPSELEGKQIKDSRGGEDNIHSWDIGLRGSVSKEQRSLLECLLLTRRRKSVAAEKKAAWRDGMPLTARELEAAYNPLHSPKIPYAKIQAHLDDLASKGYLAPKPTKDLGEAAIGYDLVSGKLSFEISHILDKKRATPTLVATDAHRLAVQVNGVLRRLSPREGLRLFDFPESYGFPADLSYSKIFDLLGNSVSVRSVEAAAKSLLSCL